MSEGIFLDALTTVCLSVVAISALAFINGVLKRRHERMLSGRSNESDRLDRIERAVETTALEVERISEASRFMSKLLSERSMPSGLAGRQERVITPH